MLRRIKQFVSDATPLIFLPVMGLLIWIFFMLACPTKVDAHHAPGVVAVERADHYGCSAFNVRQDSKGVTTLVTAGHCIQHVKVFNTILSDWQETDEWQAMRVIDPQTGEEVGPAAVVFKQEIPDVAVLVYISPTPVMTLPVSRIPLDIKRGEEVTGCGILFVPDNEPFVQSLCVSGLWLGELSISNREPYYALQLPVRSGMSGGPILYQGRAIGIYSIAVMPSVAGMTALDIIVKYLEDTR